METIELRDGGLLLYDEAFLPPDLADRYFVDLRDQCVWEQKPGVFGHMQPRFTASYGDEGVTYRYSGTENVAHALDGNVVGDQGEDRGGPRRV